MSSATSRRTGGPKRRRRSSFSRACSRFSASSSSTSRSSLRVTRKVWCSSTSMPGKSWSRWAAMTSSSGTKRHRWCSSPSTAMSRGSSGGTFTRAKCCFSVAGLRRMTARLSESPEMYGKGCAGSTASGVSTGKTWSRKNACSRSCSASGSSPQWTRLIPASSRAGSTRSRYVEACAACNSWARREIPPRTSRGSRPLAAVTARPVAMRRLRPATRTMKNSSRLLAKIARNRVRSSSGILGSRASSSTRSLNASHDSSRSRKRSEPRRTPSAALPSSTAVRRRGELTREIDVVPAGSVVVVPAGSVVVEVPIPEWSHDQVTGSLLRGPAGGCAQEHDVGVPVAETQGPVHGSRRGVVALHVEHRLVEPQGAQVPQAGDRQGPAEPAALLARVHADDVHLADRFVPVAVPLTVAARSVIVAARPVIVAPVAAVHLGPVEPDQPRHAAGAGLLRQQEALRVEPRLADPRPQVRRGPRALLRVVGEGGGVERQPGLVVVARPERPQPHTGGQWRVGQRYAQRAAPLLPPPPLRDTPRRRQGPPGRVVAVRPQPQPVSGRGLDRRLDERPPVPPAAVGRVDHDLGAGAGHGVGRVEMGVAGELAARADRQQEVLVGSLAAVPQVQPDVLAERLDAVGLGGAAQQRLDALDVLRREPVRSLDPDAGRGTGLPVHPRHLTGGAAPVPRSNVALAAGHAREALCAA